MKTKDKVIESFKALPSNATILDMQYRLYVLNKIQKGEDALTKSRGIPHEIVAKRMAKWLTK